MSIDRSSSYWLFGCMCFIAPACDTLAEVPMADVECVESHTPDRVDTTRQDRRHDDAQAVRVLEGPLSWVADGDSIFVRVDDRDVEVRLADIDAPERDQPYGWEAKLGLIDLLRGRQLRLVPRDVDRHGRIVARVWIDDLDVSRELISRGLAWFYPAYGRDSSLRCEEWHARAERRGLWAQRSPRAPWAYRREMGNQDRERGR